MRFMRIVRLHTLRCSLFSLTNPGMAVTTHIMVGTVIKYLC